MRIGLLGSLEVSAADGTPVEVGGRRARALLTLLALDAGRVVPSTRLIDLIWGDNPPDGAPNALQALVSRLRRSLPGPVLESHPAGYRLAIPPQAVDTHRFAQLAAAGRRALASEPERAATTLETALALWRGPALADVAGAAFARAQVDRLEELRSAAIEDHAEAALGLGDGRDLVTELAALVTAQPTRERGAGLLMRALCAAGRSGDALAVYARVRATLADRLGADPSPELAELHQRILRGEPPTPATPAGGGTGATPAGGGTAKPAGREPPRHNLRAELTSFVGRDEDMARVGKLVDESRLITLTGPGGAGKTRLAVESARAMLDQLPDGAWLVELAPLTDAADVPHAALAALGLGDQRAVAGGRGLGTGTTTPAGTTGVSRPPLERSEEVDRLATALASQQSLLVLDNCEHLVAEIAALAQRLLDTCPRLRILATSREPLGITGETLWPVEPLALPPAGADATEAMTYAAVRLLADRAAAVRPDFTVDQATAPAVVHICRALDGIPLAIELAAARLRHLSPGHLAERLDDRFRLLAGGSRTALPRHQTLRAVVDWSWELLDEPERLVLRRLAGFSGGATLAAAEHVCGGEVPADRVLDLLTALADRSLLVAELTAGEPGRQRGAAKQAERYSGPYEPAQPRYRLLETIKAYGLARLAEAGEVEQVRRAHAAYFAELAMTAEPLLRTGEQSRWLRQLSEDRDNLHAALRGAIAAGDTGTALRLVAGLGWYWSLAGHRREGLELAVPALAMPGEVPDEIRALAYTVAACSAVDLLNDAEIERWFATATRLAARTDLRHPMLRLVGPLTTTFAAWTWSGRQVAPPAPMASLVEDPDPWVRGTALVMGACVSLNSSGFRPGLAEDMAAGLAAYRRAGDRWGTALALHSVGELATMQGDLATAIGHGEEAVALVAALGIPEDAVLFRLRLAELRWLSGDRAAGSAELAEAVREAERFGAPGPRAKAARVAAELARLAGDLATARWQLAAGRAAVAEGARTDPATATVAAMELAAAPGPMVEQRAELATTAGQVAVAGGDLAGARAHLAEALRLGVAADGAPLVARVLVGIADLALASGHPERAAELLGASVAVRAAEDRSLPDVGRIAAAAGVALGDPVSAECYARGRAVDPSPTAILELAGLTLAA